MSCIARHANMLNIWVIFLQIHLPPHPPPHFPFSLIFLLSDNLTFSLYHPVLIPFIISFILSFIALLFLCSYSQWDRTFSVTLISFLFLFISSQSASGCKTSQVLFPCGAGVSRAVRMCSLRLRCCQESQTSWAAVSSTPWLMHHVIFMPRVSSSAMLSGCLCPLTPFPLSTYMYMYSKHVRAHAVSCPPTHPQRPVWDVMWLVFIHYVCSVTYEQHGLDVQVELEWN